MERQYVGQFLARGLPALQAKLAKALPGGPRIVMDPVSILAQCSAQPMRLKTAKVLLSRHGKLQKGFDKAVKHADAAMTVAASEIERTIDEATAALSVDGGSRGSARRPPPARYKPPADAELDVSSPNVLTPLVDAFIALACLGDEAKALLCNAIAEIRVLALPGATPDDPASGLRSLALVDASGSPVVATGAPVSPSSSVRGGVLVYTACFEKGTGCCFSKDEVLDFLEANFRCRELSYVQKFLAEAVPAANEQLRALINPAVEVEVDWPSIFPAEGLKIGRDRLAVAKTLCHGGSQLVPLVRAFNDVIAKAGPPGPGNPAQAAFAQRITRILLTSALAGKPTLVLRQDGILVYTMILPRDARGCFVLHETMAELRKIFGIATPADEKGVTAVVNKAGAGIARLGSDLSKGISKMKFGFGKKKK